MSIRTVIVDDEPPARDELAYLLSSVEDVQIVAFAGSAREAELMIREHSPDLVFLDIQMPGGNGFDVVSALMDLDCPPLYVFATAFDQYAIRAFEENAVDYVLKPITEERLAKSIARVREALDRQDTQCPAESEQGNIEQLLLGVGAAPNFTRIPVERSGRITLLKPAEVVFATTQDRKLMIHTRNDIWPCHSVPTMDALEERLAGHAFFRAGRSALVNLACIREFSPWFNGKYNLVMDDADGTELTVSRGRVPAFKEKLGL